MCVSGTISPRVRRCSVLSPPHGAASVHDDQKASPTWCAQEHTDLDVEHMSSCFFVPVMDSRRPRDLDVDPSKVTPSEVLLAICQHPLDQEPTVVMTNAEDAQTPIEITATSLKPLIQQLQALELLRNATAPVTEALGCVS